MFRPRCDFRRLYRNERGSAATVIAISLAAMLGFAAISVDAAALYTERQHLANAADAAALAGARMLPDTAQATLTAYQIAEKNGVPASDVLVTPGSNKVSVVVRSDKKLFFANIFGKSSQTVAARATAESGAPGAVKGAVPLGVQKTEFAYGELYPLKLGGGGGSHGNFLPLAFGGTGSGNYEQNLKNGYDEWVRVGQWVDTEPGNMTGSTRDARNYRIDQDPDSTYTQIRPGSPRLVICPIIDMDNVNGRGQVQIVGFGVFFIEASQNRPDEINGRFLRYTLPGELDPSAPDYGARVIRLTQ